MRKRLYFLLPDVESTRKTANALLLARIDDSRMHVMAQRGTDLGELHQASFAQMSDLARGAEMGLVVGGLCGVLFGVVMLWMQPYGLHVKMIFVLAAALGGALFGSWSGSMIGASTPNSRLKDFAAEIEAGRILLMVDTPVWRIEEIRSIVLRLNVGAASRGFEPTFPAFP